MMAQLPTDKLGLIVMDELSRMVLSLVKDTLPVPVIEPVPSMVAPDPEKVPIMLDKARVPLIDTLPLKVMSEFVLVRVVPVPIFTTPGMVVRLPD